MAFQVRPPGRITFGKRKRRINHEQNRHGRQARATTDRCRHTHRAAARVRRARLRMARDAAAAMAGASAVAENTPSAAAARARGHVHSNASPHARCVPRAYPLAPDHRRDVQSMARRGAGTDSLRTASAGHARRLHSWTVDHGDHRHAYARHDSDLRENHPTLHGGHRYSEIGLAPASAVPTPSASAGKARTVEEGRHGPY